MEFVYFTYFNILLGLEFVMTQKEGKATNV